MERGATLNGPTGSEPLFVVADPSQLHAELFIYPGDLGSVATGQPVRVTSFDGGRSAESEIEFLSPMIDPDSQRAIAHVEIPNEDGQWRPGERIKTDRRDALTLARQHRSGDLVAVWCAPS